MRRTPCHTLVVKLLMDVRNGLNVAETSVLHRPTSLRGYRHGYLSLSLSSWFTLPPALSSCSCSHCRPVARMALTSHLWTTLTIAVMDHFTSDQLDRCAMYDNHRSTKVRESMYVQAPVIEVPPSSRRRLSSRRQLSSRCRLSSRRQRRPGARYSGAGCRPGVAPAKIQQSRYWTLWLFSLPFHRLQRWRVLLKKQCSAANGSSVENSCPTSEREMLYEFNKSKCLLLFDRNKRSVIRWYQVQKTVQRPKY
jgi:hypothetical protein